MTVHEQMRKKDFIPIKHFQKEKPLWENQKKSC